MQSIKNLFSPSHQDNFSTQETLILIGLAGLASLLIAILPLVGILNYPFRLLLTLVHELGHGLAALLTGGDFGRFIISPDGSGLAYTSGGWRFVIIPAGYLGVAIFGAVLILLGRNHRWARWAMGFIGLAMIYLALRYGLPSVLTAQFLSGLLTIIVGLVFGILFLWVAVQAPPGWIIFLIHLVAIQAALTAFSDLFNLVGISTRFFTPAGNDAQSMAQLTSIPAIFWALLWVVVAFVLIGGAIWVTWLAPNKREEAPSMLSPSQF